MVKETLKKVSEYLAMGQEPDYSGPADTSYKNFIGSTKFDYGPFTLTTPARALTEGFDPNTLASASLTGSDEEEARDKAAAAYKNAIKAGAGAGVSQDYIRGWIVTGKP